MLLGLVKRVIDIMGISKRLSIYNFNARSLSKEKAFLG